MRARCGRPGCSGREQEFCDFRLLSQLRQSGLSAAVPQTSDDGGGHRGHTKTKLAVSLGIRLRAARAMRQFKVRVGIVGRYCIFAF